jgi:aspartyl-tRNA(Asn)/glutamyl-tRNA(Gln) amidotransferase subunit A
MIKNTAAQMSSALEKGETTSVELTKIHLDRIADVDQKVKAFLHVDGESALKQAAAVDADRASGKSSVRLLVFRLRLKMYLLKKEFQQLQVPRFCRAGSHHMTQLS